METATAQYTAHGVVALFGAIVHALDANRKGNTKSFVDFIALTVMSSFSGVVFALLGLQFFPDQVYFTAALAGTGGYMGIEGMSIAIAFIKKRFT